MHEHQCWAYQFCSICLKEDIIKLWRTIKHDVPPDGVVCPPLPGYSIPSYVQLYNKMANWLLHVQSVCLRAKFQLIHCGFANFTVRTNCAYSVPNWLLHIWWTCFDLQVTKIPTNVLWYVYFIPRNKLLIISIISTHLTGSYIDYHVSRHVLCTM